MQSGAKGDHFDFNLLADLAVVLHRIAHIIENEIHGRGVIDVNLYGEPMRLRSVDAGGHSGVCIDFAESAGWRRTASLSAQHQGEPNSGHAGEYGE
jgi:hypothetical protein